MKERITELMTRERLTSTQFSAKTGIQRAALSHILNERNKPSLEVVMKIHQAFPHVNLDWLLYGTGNMLKDDQVAKTEIQPDLFAEIRVNGSENKVEAEKRQENGGKSPENDIQPTVIQEIKYIEKELRKITEIRIFYDDNTYQIFKPENKQ